MKRVILYCFIMFFIFSFAVSQSNYKYRGYSKIKLITVLGENNPIISESRLNSMAKSMGYNTLPKGIYFDKDSYNANVSEVESLFSFEQPLLYININVLENKNSAGRYFGNINVELLMSGNSRFIEYQSKNSTSESWLSEDAKYSLLQKSTIINNYSKSSIVNIVREYIQEIFDELNILIRDYP